MSYHVSNKVQEVLRYYWNGALPVDVEYIANLIGTKIHYVDTIDAENKFSGEFRYDYDTGTPIFKIRSSDSYTRRRFTLAHELGHFLLNHKGENGILFRDGDYNFSGLQPNFQEREANQFAAELLMPAFRVHSLIKNTPQTLGTLAQTFAVSESAMTYRLRNLGYNI